MVTAHYTQQIEDGVLHLCLFYFLESKVEHSFGKNSYFS